MIKEGFAPERRKEIGERALMPEPGNPPKGGTVPSPFLGSIDRIVYPFFLKK